MPTYVNNGSVFSAVPATGLTLVYAPAVGNAAMFAVYLSDDTYCVSSVLDTAGLDIFGNPINDWQNLGTINLGGARLEVWGCADIIKANPSTFEINVLFNGSVPTSHITLVEYENVTAFVSFGTNSNTGYNDLFFNGTAASNNDMLVAFFMCLDQPLETGNGVIGDIITPAVSRGSYGSSPSFLNLEQTVIGGGDATQNGELVAQAYSPIVSVGMAAIGVVITGGLVLSTPPGFSNIDEASLVAGQPCRALTLAQISENAALGMVRPEVFYTVVQNGDTIPEQISPVDGYQYSQDEQIYIYTPNTTFQAGNTGSNGEQSGGWPSQAGILFYCEWDIQQSTDPQPGLVTCVEYYHVDGNAQPSSSSDGQLSVMIVCQRAQTGIVLSPMAGAYTIDPTLQGQDLPVTQSLMQALAHTSKFAAVKTEVFYCGEFTNGQDVPRPISPADGYIYDYSECSFISSWKWTTQPGAFVSPPFASANGGNADGGWSQLNELQAQISATGAVSCAVFFNNHGVIDPSQPNNGGVVYGRLRVFCFCQRRQGPNFGLGPFPNSSVSLGAITTTLLSKVNVPATATGALQVGIAAGSGALDVSKVCIKKCVAGSLTVLSTTVLTFSSSDSVVVPLSTTVLTDSLAGFTFDVAHDYYVMVVCSDGYFAESGPGPHTVNSNCPVQYPQITGDQSGVTSINPTWLLAVGTNMYALQQIQLTLSNGTAASEFADIPINAFIPGQPLPYTLIEQIALNTQEGSRAVEVFGPTNHVNADTIALPVSPIDGYEYARQELSYIWQWRDTGTAATRVFGFGASVSATGVVSTFVWHVPSGSPPTCYGAGGSEPADGSIDVIVVACRSAYAAASSNPLPTVNSNPPSDVTSMAFGGSGGFEVGS